MAKGMILAAGLGERLRPLTTQLPKPLLPVANLPAMGWGIRALRRVGITDICVNISYKAPDIRETFDDGSRHKVRLHWSVEEEPLGTAGGLKGVERHLRDDLVVVVAGDAMLDIDLAPLLSAHRASGALATLATLHVEDPSQYGVVLTAPDGRITRFQEKPAPGTQLSNEANTGIYLFDPALFDLIPADTKCDFALDIFPEILRRGLPFHAVPVTGYWTDIGNPGAYLQANLDYLEGYIRVKGPGRRVGSNLVARSAAVSGARLSHCVVGDYAVVPPGSEFTGCVVWPGTRLREPLRLSSAVLTPQGVFHVEGRQAHPLDVAGVLG